MRSNLLSLQNISGQVSSTQNKLSTGNKVNSAIDNPSSYYTALSLNNRADDLNALLDSMGQAVSTIKAATTALESAAGFLEQASAVATQALETAKIPSKSFFEEKVGENGAVVSTAQELKDAVAAGKETICVYGAIDYFENESLTLQEGQKLVGTEYFTGYTGQEKFSQISFKGLQKAAIETTDANNSIISDLELNFNSTSTSNANLIYNNSNTLFTVNNLDLNFRSYDVALSYGQGAISSWGGNLQLNGHINIDGEGRWGGGIFLLKTKATISEGAVINIKARGNKPDETYGVMLYSTSVLDIYGQLNIETTTAGILLQGIIDYSGNVLNIYNGSSLSIQAKQGIDIKRLDNQGRINTINISSGALINLKDDAGEGSFIASENLSRVGPLSITTTALKSFQEFKETENKTDWNDFLQQEKEEAEKPDSAQYQEIINQYDSLIKDASYKGINLLQNDKLSVKFNEDSTASLDVQGKDMSSKALGFKVFDWQTQGDIAESLSEIASALKSIRNYSSELGNNYSIITTRQDFTESLVNVLTEGADKLTLADMNEESANMLALQTRQQLAINSLSLASQASQSILKLF